MADGAQLSVRLAPTHHSGRRSTPIRGGDVLHFKVKLDGSARNALLAVAATPRSALTSIGCEEAAEPPVEPARRPRLCEFDKVVGTRTVDVALRVPQEAKEVGLTAVARMHDPEGVQWIRRMADVKLSLTMPPGPWTAGRGPDSLMPGATITPAQTAAVLGSDPFPALDVPETAGSEKPEPRTGPVGTGSSVESAKSGSPARPDAPESPTRSERTRPSTVTPGTGSHTGTAGTGSHTEPGSAADGKATTSGTVGATRPPAEGVTSAARPALESRGAARPSPESGGPHAPAEHSESRKPPKSIAKPGSADKPGSTAKPGSADNPGSTAKPGPADKPGPAAELLPGRPAGGSGTSAPGESSTPGVLGVPGTSGASGSSDTPRVPGRPSWLPAPAGPFAQVVPAAPDRREPVKGGRPLPGSFVPAASPFGPAQRPAADPGSPALSASPRLPGSLAEAVGNALRDRMDEGHAGPLAADPSSGAMSRPGQHGEPAGLSEAGQLAEPRLEPVKEAPRPAERVFSPESLTPSAEAGRGRGAAHRAHSGTRAPGGHAKEAGLPGGRGKVSPPIPHPAPGIPARPGKAPRHWAGTNIVPAPMPLQMPVPGQVPAPFVAPPAEPRIRMPRAVMPPTMPMPTASGTGSPGVLAPGQGPVRPGATGQAQPAMPGRAAAGQILPGQPLPGQALPVQPVPGQPVPGQPIPGQIIPGQPMPGQPIPGQIIPGQAVPGQPMPGQPLPGQALPGQPLVPGQTQMAAPGAPQAFAPGAPLPQEARPAKPDLASGSERGVLDMVRGLPAAVAAVALLLVALGLQMRYRRRRAGQK